MTIKELRGKYQLSQSALAESIGVSSSTISAIESGRMKVSIKIADAVKATYGEVIEIEEKTEKKAEKAEQKAKETKTKAQATKKKAEAKAAEKTGTTRKKAVEAVGKALPKKVEVLIQSPMGGEITPEAIVAKVGPVDRVYIRVDQNRAYWVNGEDTGSVELW